MKITDISDEDANSYTEVCSCCGLKQIILTQRDNYPEYYTNIYLQCQCGEYIKFQLPVN